MKNNLQVDLLLLPVAMLVGAAMVYQWIASARAFDRWVKRVHDSNHERLEKGLVPRSVCSGDRVIRFGSGWAP